MKKAEAIVCNEEGLHMRPAMFITDIASQYKCKVEISTFDSKADAKSIMQVMLVYAPTGEKIVIIAEGEGEEEVVDKIQKLINDGFSEKEFRKAQKLEEVNSEPK